MLLRTASDDLSSPDFRLRQRAQRVVWHADSFDFGRRTSLSAEAQELAWGVASQASYAEQVGLLAAAALATEVDDFCRLSLATAVADEARHAEVFARYALSRGKSLMPPQEGVTQLDRAMASIDDHLVRFFVHTGLEWGAVDQMILYARIFDGDVLSDIYAQVCRDEARHVEMGMRYISRRLRKSGAGADWVRRHEALLFRIAGLDESFFAWMSSLAGMSAGDLRRWWMRRHARRIACILRSEKGAPT